MRLKLPKITLSKNKLLIIAGIILAGLAVAYSAYSFLAWRNYQQATSGWMESAEASLDRALEQPIGDQLTAEAKRRNLAETTDRLIEQSKQQCQFPALVGWQTVFGPVGRLADDCRQEIVQLKTRASSLQSTTQLLQAEAELASLIDQAIQQSAKTAKDESKWDQAHKSWQQAADKVGQLGGGAEFTVVKDAAQQTLTGVAKAWQALAKAHKDQDEAAFKSADASLTKAYAKLAEIDKLSQQALSDKL